MATRNEEDGGSRLWRGMRHLIFGDEAEPTLRDEIEEAIDEAEDSRPVAGDLSPAERQMLRNLLHFGERNAGDICVTRGDIIAVPSTIYAKRSTSGSLRRTTKSIPSEASPSCLPDASCSPASRWNIPRGGGSKASMRTPGASNACASTPRRLRFPPSNAIWRTASRG